MKTWKGAPRSGSSRKRGQDVWKASPNVSQNGGQYSTGNAGETRKLNIFCSNYDLQAENIAPELHPVIACVYFKNDVAKSTSRFGDRNRQRRTSAHTHDDGAFFVPAHLRYGGCVGETFGSAGSFVPGSPTPAQTATPCLATAVAVPKSDKGTDIMKHPISTFLERRAASHRAMAYAALRADSSLRVRRNRYNRHIEKARAAEAALSSLQTTTPTNTTEHRHA